MTFLERILGLQNQDSGPGKARPDRRALLRRVRRVEITTRALVEGLMAGRYRSVFRGQGVDLAEIREYIPGDDVRAIDWNVTARFGHPFVRTYMEERDTTVYFVIDRSASAGFGSLVPREETVLEATAALAFAALRNNDRVGLVLFTDRVERFIPARKGRRHLIALLNVLIDHVPVSPRTDIPGVLAALGHRLTRRATLVVISDLFGSPGSGPGGHSPLLAPLRHLRLRHDVAAIRVTDAREHALPDVGLILLEDIETGEQLLVDTSDAGIRSRFGEVVGEEARKVARVCGEAGVDLLAIRTGEPVTVPLRHFFKVRARRVRRR
jgi:uncharacterized protein (DUF58 family)